MGAFYFYQLITSKEERRKYRTKLQKQITDKRNKLIKKNNESLLQLRFRKAGLPITAFSYQVVRWSLILVISMYYLLAPIIEGHDFKFIILSIPSLLIIFTEPVFPYSLISQLLKLFTNRRKRHMVIEMFQLFDILKAELLTLKKEQEVNIYSILKDSLTMFDHINGTISRFLSFWRTDANRAKDVFVNEIGGESARILGEILFKMDKTSKDTALEIIDSEARVFTYQYYETELQQSGKQRIAFYVLFMSTNILIIAWLILLVVTMFTSTINQSSL